MNIRCCVCGRLAENIVEEDDQEDDKLRIWHHNIDFHHGPVSDTYCPPCASEEMAKIRNMHVSSLTSTGQ